MDGLLIASTPIGEGLTVEVTQEAETPARGLHGTALVFGAVGNSSAGPTRFEVGSLELPEDLSRVKLLLDHDSTDPLGYLAEADLDDQRLSVKFSVAEGERGDMLLGQAKDKRRDGLSVGCQIKEWHMDGETIVITKASLYEVSMVSIPAFADARITDVYASLNQTIVTRESLNVTDGVETVNESENVMPENTNVENVTAAAAPMTPAATPIVTAANREMSLNELVKFTANYLQAGKPGNRLEAALNDIVPANTPAMGPLRPTYVGELWNSTTVNRPLIETIGTKELHSLKINGFRWSTRPTVAQYAGNKAAIPSSNVATEMIEATAQRFAGGWDIDRVYVDLSTGDFDMVEAVYRMAVEDYKLKTEAYVSAQVLAGATVVEYADTNSVVAALGKVGDYFAGLGTQPDFIQFSTDYWTKFVGMKSSDAPWFLQQQGSIALGNRTGNAGGVSFSVNPALPAGQVLAGNKGAIRIAEKTPPIRVTAMDLPRGGVDLGVFGYIAVLVEAKSNVLLLKDSTPGV